MTESAGTRLRAWLARPYPLWFGSVREAGFAALATAVAAALCFFFRPFGLGAMSDADAVALVARLALAGLGALLVLRVAMPAWIERRYDASRWTVLRQVIRGVVEVVVVAGVLVTVLAWGGHIGFDAKRARALTGFAVVLALVPVTARTWWRERSLRERNARDAVALAATAAPTEPASRRLMARDGSIELAAGELRYAHAEHAFIDVVFVRDGERSHRLLRVAMDDTERQFPAGSVLRCHPAWLVAVDAVAGVRGNAQGLWLVLRDLDETVPVSRTCTAAVKALLAPRAPAAPVGVEETTTPSTPSETG